MSFRRVLEQGFRASVDIREQAGAFSGTVLVSRGSATIFSGAWGHACRSCRTPNTIETLFETESVTKIFTRAATKVFNELDEIIVESAVQPNFP